MASVFERGDQVRPTRLSAPSVHRHEPESGHFARCPDASRCWRIGRARRRASRDALSFPHGYHERGPVPACVRYRRRDRRRRDCCSGACNNRAPG